MLEKILDGLISNGFGAELNGNKIIVTIDNQIAIQFDDKETEILRGDLLEQLSIRRTAQLGYLIQKYQDKLAYDSVIEFGA